LLRCEVDHRLDKLRCNKEVVPVVVCRYLSPGNRGAAEPQVELAGATVRVRVANAGDGVLVQGNVEQQLGTCRCVHKLLHPEYPFRSVAARVVGEHLVAGGGEQDLAVERGGEGEDAVPPAQVTPHRQWQTRQAEPAPQRPRAAGGRSSRG
jgi:hypothetical protein